MTWNLDQRVTTRAGSVAAGTSGDGPPLVLAHGWPWSSFSWHRVIPALSKRYRVHWYDMPCHGEIRCRVKIIWGEDDPWIPLQRGRALHERIPQASFETLPGVGHLPQLEAPARVAIAIDRFIGGSRLDGGSA